VNRPGNFTLSANALRATERGFFLRD